MTETFDGIREGHNGVPVLFLLLFFGLMAWAVWYIYSFTPGTTGWSQQQVYEDRLALEKKAETPVPTENPYEHNDKAIQEGKGIYAANCAVCHGDNLEGGVGPDLTTHLRYGETDKEKYISIFEGREGGMPGFGDQLGRDRTWRVLAYMDSVREYGARP